MSISADAEETFDRIQHPIMTKSLSKQGIEGNVLNLLKGTYQKKKSCTTNIIFKGGKLNVFTLRSDPFLLFFFVIVLEILVSTIMTENKRHIDLKGRNETFYLQVAQ